MKKLVYTLVCLILVFCCQNCKEEEPDNATGCIYGTITDNATGEPIKSALVVLAPGGKSTLTDSDGYFEFLDLDAGQYAITAGKSGYYTDRKLVHVVTGETVSVAIVLRPQQ
ncbi:MAG: carboxypeptidase-like regulatory domain-containing protein [Candidatus Aphodosoma sp.]